MMRSSLMLFLLVIFLMSEPYEALGAKQDGNDSVIEPRKISHTVNLDTRTIEVVNIQSPKFPENYTAIRQVIEWAILSSSPIKLYCPVFTLRSPNKDGCVDFLEISDGSGASTRYCGNDLSGVTLTLTDNAFLIFKSTQKPKSKFQGFNCSITPEPKDCSCGVYVPPIAGVDKIVGGNTTIDNQFPWQAVMVRHGTNSLRCGGSIINDQYVLTAAHCTSGISPDDIQILLGVWCWSDSPPEKLRLEVNEIKQHAGYNPSTLDNDISLLKLEDSIDFVNTQFRPICLPITNTDPIPHEDDVNAAITGFGRLESGGVLPDCDQYAIVPTMTNERCQELYGGSADITPNMICAGFPRIGGIDSCQGDSGGPMMANATSSSGHYYVQIGIVSWGFGCAHPDYPGVYVRVSSYIEWIHTNTEEASTCAPA